MKKIDFWTNSSNGIADESVDFDSSLLVQATGIDKFIETQCNFASIEPIHKQYDKVLKRISKTRETIMSAKRAKDKLFHELVRFAQPPYPLAYAHVNQKALITLFLQEFNPYVYIHSLSSLKTSGTIHDLNKLEQYFVNKGSFTDSIEIVNYLSNMLHLIDINVPSAQIMPLIIDMLYEAVTIDNIAGYTKGSHVEKYSSIAWIKGTIEDPDYIFGVDADTTDSIKPDLIFVRNTGKGTTNQPYMHHYVALARHGKSNKYSLKSQFPLKKDSSKKGTNAVSNIENKIDKNKVIYTKNGVKAPF